MILRYASGEVAFRFKYKSTSSKLVSTYTGIHKYGYLYMYKLMNICVSIIPIHNCITFHSELSQQVAHKQHKKMLYLIINKQAETNNDSKPCIHCKLVFNSYELTNSYNTNTPTNGRSSINRLSINYGSLCYWSVYNTFYLQHII